jgi:ATP-dependent Lon protease
VRGYFPHGLGRAAVGSARGGIMSDQAAQVSTGAEQAYAVPSNVPALPLRDTVLFPNSFMPLAVARPSSVRLIDEAIAAGKLIGVFTQRDPSHDDPRQDDLYQIGTLTHVHKMFKLPDGSLRLIVQGLARLRLNSIASVDPYLRAEVSEAEDILHPEDALEVDALQRNVRANFHQVVQLSPVLSDDLTTLAANISDASRLADFVASSLSSLTTAARQDLLATLDVRARLNQLNRLLTKELEVLELGSKIQSQVQSEVGRNQREYFLREQMKAIQKELGEGDDQRSVSSSVCRRCPWRPPSIPSHGPTSTGWSRCRGRCEPKSPSTWHTPSRCSMPSIRDSSGPRTAFSSTWRCASSSRT